MTDTRIKQFVGAIKNKKVLSKSTDSIINRGGHSRDVTTIDYVIESSGCILMATITTTVIYKNDDNVRFDEQAFPQFVSSGVSVSNVEVADVYNRTVTLTKHQIDVIVKALTNDLTY